MYVLFSLYEASDKIDNNSCIASNAAIKMPLMQIPCQLSCFYFDKCLADYDVLLRANEYSSGDITKSSSTSTHVTVRNRIQKLNRARVLLLRRTSTCICVRVIHYHKLPYSNQPRLPIIMLLQTIDWSRDI